MKKYSIAFFPLAVIFFTASGCFYDKADEVYPVDTCDTTDMRYSVEVKAILDQYCESCHGGTADAGAGIQLYDYATISNLALDGQFTYGTLMSSVRWEGGASQMPKGDPQIDECSIKQLQAWVNAGAPNN